MFSYLKEVVRDSGPFFLSAPSSSIRCYWNSSHHIAIQRRKEQSKGKQAFLLLVGSLEVFLETPLTDFCHPQLQKRLGNSILAGCFRKGENVDQIGWYLCSKDQLSLQPAKAHPNCNGKRNPICNCNKNHRCFENKHSQKSTGSYVKHDGKTS